MSCPRYVVEIKLYGTDCRYTWKMKTRVGDHKGFQKEMEVLAERGEFERISEGFVKHNGGLAKIEREWLKKVAAHKVMEQHSEAFEKLAENKMTDEIKELKKQVEELKKENTELQRELSVHNFLDTGVPQERLDYQRELKKEIIRLKSLNRRAADEIRDLDSIIIDFVEGNAFPQKNEDDLWAGEASINLLNRLDGRTSGGYVENYEDLLSEMKAIDGE